MLSPETKKWREQLRLECVSMAVKAAGDNPDAMKMAAEDYRKYIKDTAGSFFDFVITLWDNATVRRDS